MPKVADLSREIENYRLGMIPFGEYEDRFRDAAATMFAESQEVIEACFEIEAALSRYHFEGITEDELREELAAAIAPFSHAPARVISIGVPEFRARSANEPVPTLMGAAV